jgi:hypothetical protein
MAAKVEQNYKEHATSIDRWGRYTSVEVPYIVFDAADEDAALTAVLNTAPKTLHSLPLDAIEIDSREGDTTFKVNATYRAETSTESYGDDEEDEESTISFDCGAGTKHVSFAIDQRIAYGSIDAGGAIGWNGKHGTEMEIAGVDIPTAELRETHTKTMRVSRLTNSFIRKVAGFVGKVNSKTFNGWQPGEAMFLGMGYSRAKSAKHVSVTFHFSIHSSSEVETSDTEWQAVSFCSISTFSNATRFRMNGFISFPSKLAIRSPAASNSSARRAISLA